MPHRSLLAIAWAHDHSAGRDLPNQFSLSEDGARFGPVRSTGLPGQTCAVEWLPDGRLLCVYNHRHGEPGVRAAVSEFRADSEWPVQEQKVLWGQAAGTAGRSATIVGSMNLFRFGYPRILPLAEGDFLVSFWCLEEAQLVCRWVRLGVS
ncbi:MAG: hypothetical protein FJX77_08235 [Armatimonadetes bacterium]|nr:hypothetical protein [Armatimonadota bacterium]